MKPLYKEKPSAYPKKKGISLKLTNKKIECPKACNQTAGHLLPPSKQKQMKLLKKNLFKSLHFNC